MKIVNEFPPNIEAIRKKFPLKGNEIFAWGSIIYNPSGGELTPALISHEGVHELQQKGNPEKWWKRYLRDDKWRFDQELEAHQAEYQTFCRDEPNRNRRRAFLKALARRLSAPMYGRIATYQRAHNLIKKGRPLTNQGG